MSINFHQLRCFDAVAVHSSFTAAARALHVGQPSVTTHVKALESRFGAELFFRRGHSVQLTAVGARLFDITRQLFALEQRAEETLRAAGGLLIGDLRIAAFNPVQATRMVAAFSHQYPAVRLFVTLCNTREMTDALISLRADVATLPRLDDPRFHCVAYGAASIVLLVHRTHPWVGRSSVALAELAGQRMVMREEGSLHQRLFTQRLVESGISVEVTLETDSQEAVREAVAAEMGIGLELEADATVDPRLCTIPLPEMPTFPQLEVATLVERKDSPLVRAFFQLIEQHSAMKPVNALLGRP